MCGPVAAVAASMVAGMAAAKMMQPDIPDVAPTKPGEPPKQGAKQPEIKAMRAANNQNAGINAGPASTFLTGATGIDPSKLTLGKNTLLGQ